MDQKLTDEDIHYIATTLYKTTDKYDRERVYGQLCLPLHELDDFKKNNEKTGFTFYQGTLLAWRKANGSRASRQNLCEALQSLALMDAIDAILLSPPVDQNRERPDLLVERNLQTKLSNVSHYCIEMASTTQRRKLYSLEKPVWMEKAGLYKGIGHDRQHLSIILAPGTSFKIRQVEGDPALKQNLRVLNSDIKLEKSLKFGTEWVTVPIEHTSVPFVDTPYFTTIQQNVVVEYEYKTDSKTLPVYKKFDSKAEFFAQWDKQKAEFALIDSDYVLCLVPECDKEFLRDDNKELRENLNSLIDYFDRVFTFYNELCGLSFEPAQETDRNIRNRYFLKADIHGPAVAYYGGSCAAASQASIADFWLTNQDSNLGNLCVIAHGYQGGFMKSPGFAVGKVWNIVYAASFQNVLLGDRVWKEGWLYGYGNSDHVFESLKTYLKNKVPLDTWNLRSKLIFLMLLKDKCGNHGFTYFNQRYRRHANAPDFNPDRFTLLDMLSAACSRVSKIDVTAFIQRVGGILSDEQIEKNRLFHEKVAYPVCELVKPEELSGVLNLLNFKNPLTLVDPSSLQRTGLVGNLNIKLNIEQFPQIYGEMLTLMEGQRYALNVKISEKKISIPGIPIGVYTLILPTGKDVKYAIDKYYAVVKTGQNDLEINFKPKEVSPFLNQTFDLLGLGNYKFAKVEVDYKQRVVTVNVFQKTPRSIFKDEKYAQITVKSADGAVVFNKELHGTGATLSTDRIPFQFGYHLVIFHAEPSRFKTFVVSETGGLVLQEKTNNFKLSLNGVYNEALAGGSTMIQYVVDRIAAAAAEAQKNPRILRSKYDSRKDDIFLAVKNFPDTERFHLLEQYKDVLPTQNEAPGSGVGSAFRFSFLGLGNWEFLIVEVDFVRNRIVFTSKAGKPHTYFPNEACATVKLVDSNGNGRFNRAYVGDKEFVAETVTIPISHFGGEHLYVNHKENVTRLILTNEMQDKKLQTQRNNVYGFTPNGVTILRESKEKEHDPPALFSLA